MRKEPIQEIEDEEPESHPLTPTANHWYNLSFTLESMTEEITEENVSPEPPSLHSTMREEPISKGEEPESPPIKSNHWYDLFYAYFQNLWQMKSLKRSPLNHQASVAPWGRSLFKKQKGRSQSPRPLSPNNQSLIYLLLTFRICDGRNHWRGLPWTTKSP